VTLPARGWVQYYLDVTPGYSLNGSGIGIRVNSTAGYIGFFARYNGFVVPDLNRPYGFYTDTGGKTSY
jgi:hypothetical protein